MPTIQTITNNEITDTEDSDVVIYNFYDIWDKRVSEIMQRIESEVM